ncbi:anthranilate phosphoribosyltransferase [Hippea maritima]|uniref:Anthranilate phosphoribosyltransferase n=1 Tax=Hippea maritima (strain ATCC 700847 / DSM 10411 / MH2) TaxID=760142 RepID=F2LU55_HIPMA|nr:anthranilate phosphoribosyltransferase [Hippea maritima]AEA34518.1 Anthranilate phosphoribosyltransferase [Hippea maritima DSM 10411]
MLTEAMERLKKKESLSLKLSKTVFDSMLEGNIDEEKIAEFLVLLSDKKESAEEIAGAVLSLKQHAVRLENSKKTLDTCGTGGDGKNTFNISTAAAIICSLFTPVAKHGNRAISSKSGSFDILKELKIPADLNKEAAEKFLDKHNFVFLFAPNFHPAMKYVAGVRKKLARRTIFNLIGPLSNPSDTYAQLIGVFSRAFLGVMFDASRILNMNNVAFVSSFDGLDEVSGSSKTECFLRRDGIEEMFVFDPRELNIDVGLNDIKGFDAKTNADLLLKAFEGKLDKLADAIALNAGFSLYVAGVVDSIEDGFKLSKESIKNGKAKEKLDSLRGK